MDKSSSKILIAGGGASLALAAGIALVMTRQAPVATLAASPQMLASAISGTPVLVATRRIARGAVLRAADVPADFKQVYEPNGAVITATVFTDPAQLTALLSVAPRTLTATIAPGQQLAAPLLSGLATPSQGGAIAAALPAGFDGEAITITAPAKAVNDEITVNDRVDVIYTTVEKDKINADTQTRSTAMLVQGATVVASNPYSETYTLGLTPADAVRVAHAQEKGWSLRLAVRSSAATSAAHDVPAVVSHEFTH